MKNAKKEAHQSTHDVYNDCQIAQKKKGQKNKKNTHSLNSHPSNQWS